jgi:hypothetical protein
MRYFTVNILTIFFIISDLSLAASRTSGRSGDSGRSGMKLKARSKISSDGTSGVSSEKKVSKSAYMNYLPFGTGQFIQKKTVPGIAFGVSQGLFLGLALNSMQNITRANADVKSVMEPADKSIAARDPAANAYLDKNEKFVKENQANLKVFTGLFLLSYGSGVIDAVFDPFGSMALSAKKHRMSDSNEKANGKKGSRGAMSSESTATQDSRLSLFYYKGEEKPGYGVAMKTEF